VAQADDFLGRHFGKLIASPLSHRTVILLIQKFIMRSILLFIFVLTLNGELFGQNSSSVAFSSEECDFSIKMPTKPSISKDSVLAQGQYIHTIEYKAFETDVIYSVTCSEFPAWKMLTSKRRILSILKEVANPKMSGEIVDMKEIEVEGNYGLEYTETSGIAGSNIYNQLLLVEGNLFQMYVSSLSNDAKDEAEEFYENFKLH